MTLTVKKNVTLMRHNNADATTMEPRVESGVHIVSHHGLFSHFSFMRNHHKVKKAGTPASSSECETKSKSRSVLFRKKRNSQTDCRHAQQVPVNERDHCLNEASCVCKRKSVSFTRIAIREHELIIGDSPSCTEGPPTTLSWDYGNESVMTIDEYEIKRQPRRSMSQMKIPLQFRTELLYNIEGATANDIRRMERRMYKERKPCKLHKFFAAAPERDKS